MSTLIRKIVAGTTTLACALMMMGFTATTVQALTESQIQSILDLLESFGADSATVANVETSLRGGTPDSGDSGDTGTPGISGCSITSFDRHLSQGMSGDDVECLQIVLNSDSETQIASTGAGSPGNETNYFGPLTKSAVIKFQNKYADEILAPWNLTAGTGYVGDTTIDKLNELLEGAPITPPAGCDCTAWANVGCGSGSCAATQMYQTRTCTPSGCAATSQCTAYSTCEAPVTTGDFTVSLASNTPASSTFVAGQSVGELAKFTFTNGTSEAVKVTTLKFTRLGVSADSTLSNTYVFDGSVRVTDSASVSSGVINFNNSTGIITVPANSTKTITVKADITSGTNGETVGVGIASASDVVADADVSGNFPLNGNLMSIASATLAGVQFAATTTPSTNTSLDPQDDFTVWQNSISITTRATTLSRISFRNIGSIEYNDLQNFRLYVDGVQAGSTEESLDSNGYVTFDLSSSPKRLETGTRTVKLVADIINGSNRTFRFSVRVAADSNFVDSQYNVNVLPTIASSGSFPVQAGQQTVSTGTVTITKKTNSTSGDIVKDASAVTMALFEVKAAGEPVKIESLDVSFAATDGTNATTDFDELRNGQLYADGVQIGSTSDIYEDSHTTTYTTYNLGSSLIVNPGSPVELAVKADVYDADGSNSIDAGDTVQVTIVAKSGNAFGQNSGETIDVPGTAVSGNALTIQTGALTLAKYTAYTDQSMVAPLYGAKLGHYTLAASTTEAVNVNEIRVDFVDGGGSTTFDGSTHASNVYITYGDQTGTTKTSVSDTDNTWSVSYELAAGEVIDVIVYGDIASSAASSVWHVAMQSTGVTASSGTTDYGTGTASTDELAGQTITLTTGAFTAETSGNSPEDQVVAGGQTVTSVIYKFVAKYDTYTVNELKVRLPSGVSKVVQNAILKDGTTTLATKPFDTTGAEANDTAYFTGLSVEVPANNSKELTVDLVLGTPVSDVASTGLDAKLTLYLMKYQNSAGSITSDTTPGTGNTNPAGNHVYVYKSYPTFTIDTSSLGDSFTNGSQATLYQFKVKANNGPVSLKQLKFTVAFTDVNTQDLELESLEFFRGSTNLTTSVAILDENAASVEDTTGVTETSDGLNTIVVSWDSTKEETIPSGSEYTYTLKGTPVAFNSVSGSKDSVSLYLKGTASSADVRNYITNESSGNSVYQFSSSAAQTTGDDSDLIWSDISAIVHTAGTTSSNDWHNGYLIKNLNLSSKGWSL